MKVDFECEVDGEIFTVSVEETDISRLTDSKHKVVLYDPMEPKCSVVLDGLPSGIHFDEMSGQIHGNFLACVFPLFVAAIVGAEIVAVTVLAFKAI